MKDEKIYTDSTDKPICPHCGHEHTDTWEWEGEDFEYSECESCEEVFHAWKHISISWTTNKVDE